jgi:tetratricopeptide (TPR) repeat protein
MTTFLPSLNGVSPRRAMTPGSTSGDFFPSPRTKKFDTSTLPKVKAQLGVTHGSDFKDFKGSNTQILYNVTADPSIHVSLKKRICIDMLSQGYVHSYVDFFYLTHEKERIQLLGLPPPGINPETEKPIELEEQTDNTLHFLKEKLITAEVSMRENNTQKVYECYKEIAQHFEALSNANIAAHFYQKSLEVASAIGDPIVEGKSNRDVGLVHESKGKIAEATLYYEKYFEFATKSGSVEDIQNASQDLVRSYASYAHLFEIKGEWEESVKYYQKCINNATFGNNLKAQGVAHYQLGLVFKQLGESEKEIENLKKYLEICRETGDKPGEGAACTALASAYQSKDTERAIQFLEENLEIADKEEQSVAKAETCCDLGIIYSKEGNHSKSVEMFEQFFHLSLQIGDPKMTDRARVFLGISKGNLRVQKTFGNTLKWN